MSGNSFERKEQRKKDLAMLDGPASNVQIDTVNDITTGETRKIVLPDYGATRIKPGSVRKKKGKV